MFVSALSGMALNNHHYIYSIKTYDLDQRVEKERYERQRKLDKGAQEQFAKAVSAFVGSIDLGPGLASQEG